MDIKKSMLNVLIVGCGNIAGGYDAVGPELPGIHTHAKAYLNHGGFVLRGCVDPDQSRREDFSCRWKVERSYATLAEALADSVCYDIISICSPTAQHANDLYMAIDASPRLVFCEKPLTTDLGVASDLVEKYSKAGVLLAVNHTRRWEPEIVSFKRALQDGLWGEIRTVVGYYCKGIMNNGTHMVDLLQFLLGPQKVVAIGNAIDDFSEIDPTVSALLSTSNGISVHLATGMARDFALFEVQLVTSSGVVTLEEGGGARRERPYVDSHQFAGYRVIGRGSWHSGSSGLAMSAAVKNIFAAVTMGESLASTGESALSAHVICDNIRQRAKINKEQSL